MSDALKATELSPAGGTWAGLLFDNPTIGLPAQFTWTFTFDFLRVSRDYGSVEPNLVVDWVPLPNCSWHDMIGQQALGGTFADPIESSVYFFQHHRFERAELRITSQRGNDVYTTVKLDGDIDYLGLNPVVAEGWLVFDGITVALSNLETLVDRAEDRLAEFTDTTGLVGSWTGRNFRFAPTA